MSMDWTRLRKMMNSARPLKGKSRPGRKLGHNTYAFLYNEGKTSVDDKDQEHDEERIEVELHNKVIIRFYPSGLFSTDNHDYWRSPVTKDRLSNLLPKTSRVSSHTFNCYSYAGSARSSRYVWTINSWEHGSHPWKNKTFYTSTHYRADLSERVNQTNANELLRAISAFSTRAVETLVRGRVEKTCAQCLSYVAQMRMASIAKDKMKEWFRFEVMDHVLEDVLAWGDTYKNAYPLIAMGAFESNRLMHRTAAHLLLPEHRSYWRAASTPKQLAAQVEKRIELAHLDWPASKRPTMFHRILRSDLEAFLLQLFGFEISE